MPKRDKNIKLRIIKLNQKLGLSLRLFVELGPAWAHTTTAARRPLT